MAWIQKGDLISARGTRWVALSDSYTKLIREWSCSDDAELATVVGAVRAHPADGSGPEAELIFGYDSVSLVKRAHGQ